jgi:hypothetical protein
MLLLLLVLVKMPYDKRYLHNFSMKLAPKSPSTNIIFSKYILHKYLLKVTSSSYFIQQMIHRDLLNASQS